MMMTRSTLLLLIIIAVAYVGAFDARATPALRVLHTPHGSNPAQRARLCHPMPTSLPAQWRWRRRKHTEAALSPRGAASSSMLAAAAAAEAEEPFWSGWRVHDYFNLATLPGLIALTLLALLKDVAYNWPLAAVMWVYVFIDGVWIYLMPHIVGSPKILLGHHLATLLVVGHVLTLPAHLKYTSWLTLVEVNTFFLVLKRHVAHPLISAAFHLSWLAIRTVWFPLAAAYFLLAAGGWGAGWVGLARHVVIGGCIGGLGVLQLAWTRSAIAGMLAERRDKAAADEGGEAGGGGGTKKGFL